jgi:hypothetical protein
MSSDSLSSSASEDEQLVVLFKGFIFLAKTICMLSHLSHLTRLFHSPMLPHYRRKQILTAVGVNRLPHVQTASAQAEVDAAVTRLSTEHPSPVSFLELVEDPDRFRRCTRLSVSEFLSLYAELEACIRRPYSTANPYSQRIRRRRLHPIDQFLLWAWHSDGNDGDLLSLAFRTGSRMTADRMADHVTRAVNDTWAGEVTWPDAEERQLLYGFFSSCEKAVGVLDGTHCQIKVPDTEEGKYHSTYKKFHTQNYLICADALGFIIWHAGPYGGHDNDRAIFNNTPFVQPDCPLLSDGEMILVDGGFAGEGHIIHQFTQKELEALTEEERRRFSWFNEDFTHNRSPIEHCIHRVKNRAQALAKRWPRALHRQGELLSASVKMYNRIRRLRMEHALSHRM